MFKFLFLILIPQSQAGFLCMLASYLQRLALDICRVAHREPDTEGR